MDLFHRGVAAVLEHALHFRPVETGAVDVVQRQALDAHQRIFQRAVQRVVDVGVDEVAAGPPLREAVFEADALRPREAAVEAAVQSPALALHAALALALAAFLRTDGAETGARIVFGRVSVPFQVVIGTIATVTRVVHVVHIARHECVVRVAHDIHLVKHGNLGELLLICHDGSGIGPGIHHRRKDGRHIVAPPHGKVDAVVRRLGLGRVRHIETSALVVISHGPLLLLSSGEICQLLRTHLHLQ